MTQRPDGLPGDPGHMVAVAFTDGGRGVRDRYDHDRRTRRDSQRDRSREVRAKRPGQAKGTAFLVAEDQAP